MFSFFLFYIVFVHFFYWLSCTVVFDCPLMTLQMFKNLSSWAGRDWEGSKAAIRKLNLHTNYLFGSLVVFILYLTKCPLKQKMKWQKDWKRLHATTRRVQCRKARYSTYISWQRACRFYWWDFLACILTMQLEASLLGEASPWMGNRLLVQELQNPGLWLFSSNDIGERAVKFASDFENVVTKERTQKQAMLQGVEQYRNQRPKPTKTFHNS